MAWLAPVSLDMAVALVGLVEWLLRLKIGDTRREGEVAAVLFGLESVEGRRVSLSEAEGLTEVEGAFVTGSGIVSESLVSKLDKRYISTGIGGAVESSQGFAESEKYGSNAGAGAERWCWQRWRIGCVGSS
jgi:hypothetical protein